MSDFYSLCSVGVIAANTNITLAKYKVLNRNDASIKVKIFSAIVNSLPDNDDLQFLLKINNSYIIDDISINRKEKFLYFNVGGSPFSIPPPFMLEKEIQDVFEVEIIKRNMGSVSSIDSVFYSLIEFSQSTIML